jgi:hypothetical protein
MRGKIIDSVGLDMENEKENHEMMTKIEKTPNRRVRVPRD